MKVIKGQVVKRHLIKPEYRSENFRAKPVLKLWIKFENGRKVLYKSYQGQSFYDQVYSRPYIRKSRMGVDGLFDTNGKLLALTNFTIN